MIKCYRIKHKPTGLYFKPSKGGSNLSTKGKIYPSKPSLKWAGDTIRIRIRGDEVEKLSKVKQILINYFNLKVEGQKYTWVDEYKRVPIEDWEIEIYNNER